MGRTQWVNDFFLLPLIDRKEVLKTLGINTTQYNWKELYHTRASLTHRKGAPILAIKDQLRHTTSKTTENFYIGSHLDYQRLMIEKLVLNSGKKVEKGEIFNPTPLPTT